MQAWPCHSLDCRTSLEIGNICWPRCPGILRRVALATLPVAPRAISYLACGRGEEAAEDQCVPGLHMLSDGDIVLSAVEQPCGGKEA